MGALIAFRRFGGMQPSLSARLLDPYNAQRAVNTRFDNGKLRAFRRARQDFAIQNAGPIKSIYRYRGGGKDGWLSWDTDVDVVRAPLAGDTVGRVYYTGKGRPKVTDSTSAITPLAHGVGSVVAGQNSLTVDRNRGFGVGDPVEIDYGGGVKQTVTVTSFTPGAVNGTLGVTPVTSGTVNTAAVLTNKSQRYPIYSYDLGVPAPTVKPTATVQTGGVDGTEGVQQGGILAVSNIVAATETHMDECTILELQSGTGDAAAFTLAGHHPYHDVAGVVSNGQPMVIDAQGQVALLIRHHNETRDIVFNVTRAPTGDPILAGSDTTHIVRPAGIGDQDWDYFVKAHVTDVPVSGTYTYRMDFSPVAGLSGENNNEVDVKIYWTFTATYSTRVKLTLETGHGLAVDNLITLTLSPTPDTGPDKDLNGKTVKVLEVSGDDIIVEGVYGGTYGPGGTWKRSFTTEETSDRAYVYTYLVTINGQEFESGPSPASDIVTVSLDGTVRLTGFIDPTTPVLLWDTNFTALRIYRLNPGETVTAEYLFAAEVAISTTQYDDSLAGEALGEVLRSETWELPPADLQGLIELPEGGAAGFTGKDFCMAEPYFIHAWPQLNRRTMHDEIVAIGAFGSSIGISTKGRPYIVTGIDPATVNMERIETDQPNLSKRGSVDMGYSFVYPSPNGLMMMAVGRAEIVTEKLYTPDDWMKLNPASFVACRYQSQYMAFYDNGEEQGGLLFDARFPEAGITFLDIWGTELWTDWQTGAVYYVDGQNIKQFDDANLELDYTWLSKDTVLPRPTSIGWAKVDAERYPMTFTASADGDVIYTRVVQSREPFRMPAVLGEVWNVEVRGVHQVNSVYLAETIEDLQRVP